MLAQNARNKPSLSILGSVGVWGWGSDISVGLGSWGGGPLWPKKEGCLKVLGHRWRLISFRIFRKDDEFSRRIKMKQKFNDDHHYSPPCRLHANVPGK